MLKKALTKIIFFQILVIISLGCLLYYLYKVRIVEKINYTDIQEDITDNSITNLKAESLTLSSLVRKNENPNFKQSYFVNSKNGSPTGATQIQPQYKINNDTIEIENNKFNGAIPMFYTSTDSQNLDDNKVIELITNAVKQNNLSEIDIDVTITNKVNNIETVIKKIIYNLNPSDIKINLGLPLKYSDIFNFVYLYPVSNFYKSSASIEVLNNLCNKLRIAAYGYTSLNSSKAGPITKVDLAEDTIKYYIYKGINASKIDLVINNTAYKWPNRGYTDDYLFNYTLEVQQVNIISNDQLNSILGENNFQIIQTNSNNENLAKYTINDNINFIVYPKLEQLNQLVEMARSYGLNGFIYKNF